MEKEHIEYFKGKKVLIVLKNGYAYTAHIKSVGEQSTLIIDKYKLAVSIDNDSIDRIEPKEGYDD